MITLPYVAFGTVGVAVNDSLNEYFYGLRVHFDH